MDGGMDRRMEAITISHSLFFKKRGDKYLLNHNIISP